MLKTCAFSHKIDYITIFKENLNLEGHHYLFKSYGNFAEWVDKVVTLVCGGSVINKAYPI